MTPMNAKLRGSRTLWYIDDNEGIRYTQLVSLGTVRFENTRGIQFIFLFLNLMIAWRTKETH